MKHIYHFLSSLTWLRIKYEHIFHDNDRRFETEKYKDFLNPNDIAACKRIYGNLLAALKKSTALREI